ncbi:MAG: flagellar hook-associated protein FlgL, partial [Desulfobacterales bacterium]|nr:flagellar hook-associated protein FlgL [Desulfobacterales bacterium]
MRVTNRSTYEALKTQLGNLTESLSEANTVITTGKRINKLSDDPTGVSQVVDLRSLLKNLSQLDQNISTGKLWLNAEESSLTSIKDLSLEMKNLTVKMRNDTYNASQRKTESERVNGIIKQIANLANATVKGQYIFGGAKTGVPPIVLDDETIPTKATYNGNNTSFSVKIGQSNDVPVGLIGKDTFWQDYITVDSTNNKVDFTEEIVDGHNISDLNAGDGVNLESTTLEVKNYGALIHGTPKGAFEPLRFLWTGNDSWKVENDPGYDLPEEIVGTADGFNVDLNNDGATDIAVTLDKPAAKVNGWVEFDIFPGKRTLTATIPDGQYKAEVLSEKIGQAMTETSQTSGYGIEYKVAYDNTEKKFNFKDDGSYAGFIGFNLLWGTGENIGKSIGPDLGFNVEDVNCALATSDEDVELFKIDATNNSIDFEEFYDGGLSSGELNATIASGTYSNISELNTAIEKAMRDASQIGGNRITYKASYDKNNKR